MKKTRLILAVWGICLLCSCGSSLTLTGNSSFMKIKPGMTQDEVIAILGKPTYYRFLDGTEQWEYHKTHLISAEESTAIIDFIDGKVSGMNSFNSTTPPPQEIIVAERPVNPDTPIFIPPHHRVMNDKAYHELCDKIKKKSFQDDKMDLLIVGTQERWFTAQQCAGLLSLFTWEDDKMKVLDLLADRIVDPENGDVIVKQFEYLFKQEEAAERLGLNRGW